MQVCNLWYCFIFLMGSLIVSSSKWSCRPFWFEVMSRISPARSSYLLSNSSSNLSTSLKGISPLRKRCFKDRRCSSDGFQTNSKTSATVREVFCPPLCAIIASALLPFCSQNCLNKVESPSRLKVETIDFESGERPKKITSGITSPLTIDDCTRSLISNLEGSTSVFFNNSTRFTERKNIRKFLAT